MRWVADVESTMFRRLLVLGCVLSLVGCASAQRRKKIVAYDTKVFKLFKAIALAEDQEGLIALLETDARRLKQRQGLATTYYNRLAEFKGAEWNLVTCTLDSLGTWNKKRRGHKDANPALKRHLKRTLNVDPSQALTRIITQACIYPSRGTYFNIYNARRKKGWYPAETMALIDDHVPFRKGTAYVKNKARQTRHAERKRVMEAWLSDDQLSPELKLHLVTIDWTAKAAKKKVRPHSFVPNEADLALALRQIELLETERVRGEARRVTNACVTQTVRRPAQIKKLDNRIESLTKRYDNHKQAGVKNQLKRANEQRTKLVENPPTCELPRWRDFLWNRYNKAKHREGTWRKTLCTDKDQHSLLNILACQTPTSKYMPKALYKAIVKHQDATRLRGGRYRHASMAKKENLPEFFTQCEQSCQEQADKQLARNKEIQIKRAADRKKADAKEKRCRGLGAKLEKKRLGWKKCMSNADLQRTARRYAVTDKELYDNHMASKAMQCIGSSKSVWKTFVKSQCSCYHIEGDYSYKLRHRKSVSACSVSEDKWGSKD